MVVSTIDTTSTILSVLATDSFAALAPLRSQASSVQSQASRDAVLSRPLNTSPFTPTSTSSSAVVTGGSGGGGGAASTGNTVEVQIWGFICALMVAGGLLL